MAAFIQISITGVLMWMCAGDYEPIRVIGLILIIIGNLGSTATYEHLKERIEKLERQTKKENDIIRRRAANE